MIRRILSGAALGASMLAAPAQAGELMNEPMLYWHIQFGGPEQGEQQAGLGLRSAETADLQGTITVLGVETKASDVTVRVAGMPVLGSNYRLGQAEDEAGAEGDPWYSQASTWWIAGGVALSAFIVKDAKDDPAQATTGPASGLPNGETCVVGPVCVPDTGGLPDLPAPLAGKSADGWETTPRGDGFDEGTGRMGDLIAR